VCRCTPEQVARYQGRLSGPLLDRIDMQVEVPAATPGELMALPDGEASAVVAERVAAALARQQARQGEPNARLAAGRLDGLCALDHDGARLLETAAVRLGFSGRSLHRVLKLARTVADLAGSERIALPHLAEALQLRRALAGSA
jgi:magnesium chelatase family protein